MTYTSNFTGSQIDEAVDKVLNKQNFEVLTLLVPSNTDNYLKDINDETLLEHNKIVFNKLSNQTEPIIVFLKELHSDKPYAQIAMRMRHLYEQGEGTGFFAYGYYTAHTSEDKYGLLAYADDMFKLYSDGSVELITLLGERKTGYFSNELRYFSASYDQYYTSSNNVSLPYKDVYLKVGYSKTGDEAIRRVVVENLFGCLNKDIEYSSSSNDITIDDKGRITSFIIRGGWTHETVGPVDTDIIFDIDYNAYGKWPLIKMREPVVIGGWANIDTYELRFKAENEE